MGPDIGKSPMLDDWEKLQLSLAINSAVYTCEEYKKHRENAIRKLARFACTYLVDYAETDEKNKMLRDFTRVSLFEFGNKKFKIALRMCWLIFIESKEGKSLVCQLLTSLLDATDDKAKEIERDESAETYFLRALCLHERKPESEGAVHDAAEFIKVIFRNAVDPSKLLCILWECRRLSQSLCFCPISEVILQAVSESCDDRVKKMNWWIESLKNYTEEVFLGFANCFSSFITFPEELPRCAYSWRISIDVVLDRMSILYAKDYPSDRSIFLAGYLFFDLSERLISIGCLHEALVFSKQAYGLRSRLFQQKFTYGIVKVTRNSRVSYGLKSLQTSRISNDIRPINFEEFYLGPWGVLRAYLESILQVGTVYEMLGNASRADTLLSWGWNISNFEGLTHYFAAFPTILVRLSRKKREHDAAFTLVDDLVALKNGEVTCKICTLLMDVSLDLERGELCRMKGELQNGESICNDALAKLDGCEALHKRKLLMARSRTQLKNCACAPIADVINGSLLDYIKLMWEFKHKRICAKLLMCIAKCYRENIVHDDIRDIFRYCMANLSCPARYKNCDVSFSSLIKCISVDVPGDTFAIERAELLFIVCWVSLRRYPWSLCDSVRDIISQSISWLEPAFMLCREFPLLHQKVSRLLLLVNFYLGSSQFSSSEMILRSQRVAFYLQASIGTHMNYLIDLDEIEKHTDVEMLRPKLCYISLEEFNLLPSTILGKKIYDFGRHLVTSGLDDRVKSFFSHLPRAAIICLVFVKGIDASLVKHLFGSSHTGTWIVVCRIVSSEDPIVTLFPLHQIMTDDSNNQTENISNERLDDNMIYDLVPSLQVILNEREQSSHTLSEENKELWYDERKKLDIILKELLRFRRVYVCVDLTRFWCA